MKPCRGVAKTIHNNVKVKPGENTLQPTKETNNTIIQLQMKKVKSIQNIKKKNDKDFSYIVTRINKQRWGYSNITKISLCPRRFLPLSRLTPQCLWHPHCPHGPSTTNRWQKLSLFIVVVGSGWSVLM